MTATQSTEQTSTAAIIRISRAQALLPRLRDLRELRDIVADAPIYPGVGDRLLEIESEIEQTTADILTHLEPSALED